MSRPGPNTSCSILLYDILSHPRFANSYSNMEIPHPHHTIHDSSANHTSAIHISHLAGNVIFRRLLSEIHAIEILAALAIFVTFHSFRQAKTRGLPVWPVVGMVPSLVLGLRGDTYEWITGVLIRMNGTFTFSGPRNSSLNSVVTADPRNLEYLLKDKFANFPKGPFFRSAVRDLLGGGIFSADDEPWWRQRKTASIEFHSAKFRAMTAESLVELVHARLLPVLEGAVSTGTAVNLQDILLRLTFDNVCMIAFGVDPGCLRLGLPEIPFARAFEDATEATVLRFVTPEVIWKAMRFLDVGIEGRLRKSIQQVDGFANEVIRTRKKELELDSDSKRNDLLSIFMRLKDDDGKPYSDRFLRDICVNFILAGRDTSSVALTWFFWLLEQHPAVEDQILGEIRRIVGKRGCSGDGKDDTPMVFRPDEVKRMEYLQAALSESLRLYPSVPMDHKEV